MYHIPVLLHESIEGLNIKPGGVYVDTTFGGGGHARYILEKLDQGRLVGFDQDPDARVNLPEDDRVLFINQNFRYLKNFLTYHQIEFVDGILADLGVSSHQFDEASRGFSIRGEGRLDMRMNPGLTLTAKKIVNEYTGSQLEAIFRNYGEINNARCVTKLILEARAEQPINTTARLVAVVEPCFPKTRISKFMAMVFQALRIEVNDELGALKSLLEQSPGLLHPGGRLVVISYHSLEDRLVKNYFRTGNFEGTPVKDFYGNLMAPLRVISSKAIKPSEEEIKQNSRARSARLRIAEKINL